MGLPSSPACQKNRRPIHEALELLTGLKGRFLEIGTGTAEHAVYFSQQVSRLDWQCTDLEENLEHIEARIALEADGRLPRPFALDVLQLDWPKGLYDAVFTANTPHIMPWENTLVMLDRVGEVLAPCGQLIIYGPFHDNDVHTAPSNLAFDQSLKSRDPAMGVRDAVELTAEAAARGFLAEADLPLPANNRILVFRKADSVHS
jgi:hypothetical protein